MPEYRFSQLDVFASSRYSGNPLAVVHDADDLDDVVMQRFANWTGLSETTFLTAPTAPGADYRVRIFTASRELPFAGHPTLGSAYAWLRAGGLPQRDGQVVQQCGAGAVTVRAGVLAGTVAALTDDGDPLAFAAPPLTRFEPVEPALLDRIATGLGIRRDDILDSSWLVNGPEWIGIRLASAQQVLDIGVRAEVIAHLDIGVVGPFPAGSETAFEVRAFLPGDAAVTEDPVTGSLNAGLAHWLIGSGQAPSHYVASQGTALSRAGRVRVDLEDEVLWIGGTVRPSVSGRVQL